VRVGEEAAHLRQSIDVRSFGLLVPQAAHPVVPVIDTEKENVGLFRSIGVEAGQTAAPNDQ
jgi:hypothetical protein